MLEINYWSDYACPFCYIGVENLHRAIERAGLKDKVKMVMHAFELDPSADKKYAGPTAERFAKKYRISEPEAEARIEAISEMGREAGLDFRYKDTRYTRTLDAHRLHKLAVKEFPEAADALDEALYRAYFSEGKELADPNVLTDIAVAAGMPEVRVQEVLNNSEFSGDVRKDEFEASLSGVHAVPHFRIGNRIVQGAASPEELAEVLKEATGSVIQAGAACSADGCEF